MKKLWRTLGNLFGVRNPDDDIILPTGQRRSDIVAMHERALRESNEDRCERLGVTTSSNKSEQVRVGFSVSIKTEETPRPAKDASFDFSVLGSPCIVKYFSDYKYLEAVTDPEEYHYDPRRWVDVFFKEECYGYAWNEGLDTFSRFIRREGPD